MLLGFIIVAQASRKCLIVDSLNTKHVDKAPTYSSKARQYQWAIVEFRQMKKKNCNIALAWKV